MNKELKVLLLEDSPADAELIIWQLRKSGLKYTTRLVAGRAEFCQELETFEPEVILSDFNLPGFNGLEALSIARERCPETPFIIVSGTIGEEIAVTLMKKGAVDFLLKDRLGRLGPSIQQALELKQLAAEKTQHEQALRLRNRAIEASVNAVIITDYQQANNPIVYVNPAFERITGFTANEALGRNPRFLHRYAPQQPELEKIRVAIKEQRETHALLRNFRKDGSPYWNDLYLAPVRDETGQVTHFIGIQNDVSEARRYQEELEHQATHDTLTELPNRNLLQDRINQAMAYADRYCCQMGVAFLDLDNFKLINDTQGHNIGDRLLQIIATRLWSSLRESDTVARYGGDEFVLIIMDGNAEGISTLIKRIMDLVSMPAPINDHGFNVTCSVGISLYPQDGRDMETLLRNADTAMYRAKELGRNKCQFFTSKMNVQLKQRLSLENDLRWALEQGQFHLYYQPQVELETGSIIGVEALVRWRHPDKGLISPAHFIPLAEETGLIIPIGEWVLRTACAQNKAWQDAGFPKFPVAINLSAHQLQQSNFIEILTHILAETQLEPQSIELELTESLLLQNTEEIIPTLEKLKALGIKLSIDDFGTGYSNLGYLGRLPVDRLKIDQSFIRDMHTAAHNAAIAQAVISLGHALDLKVIAEGIENVEHLAFLRANRCDEGQGYYFSRPLPGTEIPPLLSSSME